MSRRCDEDWAWTDEAGSRAPPLRHTSSRRPDAYLGSKLEISVWYGRPSASARFWIASRSLLDSRRLSRRSLPNAALASTLARVAARRLADVPAERGAEGARRTVADAFGNLADPAVVAAQQILRDGHGPGGRHSSGAFASPLKSTAE